VPAAAAADFVHSDAVKSSDYASAASQSAAWRRWGGTDPYTGMKRDAMERATCSFHVDHVVEAQVAAQVAREWSTRTRSERATLDAALETVKGGGFNSGTVNLAVTCSVVNKFKGGAFQHYLLRDKATTFNQAVDKCMEARVERGTENLFTSPAYTALMARGELTRAEVVITFNEHVETATDKAFHELERSLEDTGYGTRRVLRSGRSLTEPESRALRTYVGELERTLERWELL